MTNTQMPKGSYREELTISLQDDYFPINRNGKLLESDLVVGNIIEAIDTSKYKITAVHASGQSCMIRLIRNKNSDKCEICGRREDADGRCACTNKDSN